VGRRFPGSIGDTDVVLRKGSLERTISVRHGMITNLILVALEPPRH
jgi:hypothetical protein